MRFPERNLDADIKPSNLFLAGGRPAEVKLLDFGIARLAGSKTVTRAGTLLGTPDHMAPEQVRSEVSIDRRADLFSLGCVLYQCLVREHPFASTTVSGVLSKILMEPAPDLLLKRPELPPRLCELVAALLEKDRDSRPGQAADVVAALRSIPAHEVERVEQVERSILPSRPRLTTKEQRLLSLIIVSSIHTAEGEMSTHNPIAEQVRLALISAMAESFNATCQLLPDGQILIVLAGQSAASDQARLAARLALQIRSRFRPSGTLEKQQRPMLQLAVSTGCCGLSRGEPDTAAIYRTSEMLSRDPDDEIVERDAPIWLDEVTAGLLGEHFQTRQTPEGAGRVQLIAEEQLGEPSQWVIGRRTPFFGRDSEIKLLTSLLSHCIAEPRASVALITAEAGAGKSRLAQEFVQRARAQHSDLAIWIGCGDPQRVTVPFGLVARMLRQILGLTLGADATQQHAELRVAVSQRLGTAASSRLGEFVVEFIAELLGIDGQQAPSAELQAARLSTTTLSEQIRRAVIDLLVAQCEQRPLLWVLEDMHLADRASLWLIDAALRQLAERPFCVVGLARPSVHAMFPDLWRTHPRQELKLTGLSRKTSEQIVRAMLGQGYDPEAMQKIVEGAGGNAFFLEEMVRASVSGQRSHAPPSVLAMLQSRIAQLEPLARRVLRAASIFGSAFKGGAVLRLLGEGTDPAEVAEVLHKLTTYQLIKPRLEARSEQDPEYVFTHVLVRDAAYAMMTASDRSLGHSLASQLLDEERATNASATSSASSISSGGRAEQERAAALRPLTRRSSGTPTSRPC